MELTAENLNNHFRGEEGCSVIKDFAEVKGGYTGKIKMAGEGYELEFHVSVFSMYPFQFFETETIRFSNEDLFEYGHVGSDGAICIHTTHSPDLTVKLIKDVASVREWINKYYLGDKNDNHYEHLRLPSTEDKTKHVLYFTDTNHIFKTGDSGHFYFSALTHNGAFDQFEKNVDIFLLQHFECNKTIFPCRWSNAYKETANLHKGFYIFLEQQPTWAKHFAYETWDEFKQIALKTLLEYLNDLKKNQKKKKSNEIYFPLLVGYNIPDEENTKQVPHWQLINIPYANIPIHGIPDGAGNWTGEFTAEKINWQETRNCSYEYFFGRGKMCEKISNAKILIIGVGAIGSAVAVTLARCGVKELGFIDYDCKEPENVCRSEYFFSTGITSKVAELTEIISTISPFCNINLAQKLWGVVKLTDTEYLNAFETVLNMYDIIFDCSTDNDVAYILDKIGPTSTLINLSITNHAKELVCAVSPNSYIWMMNIFKQLQNDTEDMYNPSGCWSPTFKASYNDINALIQYALKHLNIRLDQNLELRSFYLSTFSQGEFNIKINQF